jgi:hypothetical protein
MAGLLLPDAEYKAEIAQELIRRAEAEWLYYIGRDWPDKRYTPAIAGALIAAGNAEWLYRAGRDWPD